MAAEGEGEWPGPGTPTDICIDFAARASLLPSFGPTCAESPLSSEFQPRPNRTANPIANTETGTKQKSTYACTRFRSCDPDVAETFESLAQGRRGAPSPAAWSCRLGPGAARVAERQSAGVALSRPHGRLLVRPLSRKAVCAPCALRCERKALPSVSCPQADLPVRRAPPQEDQARGGGGRLGVPAVQATLADVRWGGRAAAPGRPKRARQRRCGERGTSHAAQRHHWLGYIAMASLPSRVI